MAQDLDAAYRLGTPDETLELYRNWAQTYDASFATKTGYVLPQKVADLFCTLGGNGPVLDLGAGTGLCGAALAERGMDQIDATDLSEDMLAVATRKAVYRRLFAGNLLTRLPVSDALYKGAVSSGTFTHGHVGPEALPEVIRVLAPGGLAVISVNAEHWHAKNFAVALDRLEISEMGWREVRIFAPDATGDHAEDKSRLLWLRKA